MSIVITGATGHLGRLVVERLLDAGVPASEILATGRATDKLKDLADRGVGVRAVDFNDPVSLDAAFDGARAVLLVSTSDLGQRRVQQHQNAIDAARRAGVGLLAYTSIPQADTNDMLLAEDHLATEEAVRASGIPFVLLRNSWYLENYTDQLGTILERGGLVGSAGSGRVSAAARADYAAAAAAVLVEFLSAGGDGGRVYELGGDEAFTLAELAAEIGAQTGREIGYQDLPVQEYAGVLAGAGVPEPFPAVLADSDRGIAAGELFVDSGDLRRLIGRPTTSLRDAVAAAVR